MFEKLLKFFIDNSRMNYTLFVLVFGMGILAYSKIPKEIFPTFELDSVSIRGEYKGASADILDKLAVREIEDGVKSVEGVKDITSIITPGSFTIVVELQKGKDKYSITNKIKDAVDIAKVNFPSDMDDPSVVVVETGKALLSVSISSDSVNSKELHKVAEDLKSDILTLGQISKVTIYGDSDLFYDVKLNTKKIESLGLNKSEVYTAISSISYIFPIGKIEDVTKHLYLSTYNGAKDENEFLNTKMRVSNKVFYLKDIAEIEKKYQDSSTLSSIDGKASFSLAVEQAEGSDALVLKKKIDSLLEKISKKNPDINYILHDDNSERIQDRLNIVISNIMFGIILLTLLMTFLINSRMAMVIFIGIPSSFVLAAIYFYLFGYTINMISLIGVLIALGIVVDDAIVVSEHIQYYIEKGIAPYDAAFRGAKEMAEPVVIASLTTLFAFIPSLMISGTMGEFIKLIPIALSALLVASLIETFLFLPIHAAHMLNVKAKPLSWAKANKIYSFIIHKLMTYKKTFLFMFFILVPLLIVVGVKSSKFQMFPQFDSSTANISIKANVNTKVEDSFKIVQQIEKDLLKNKEKFYIKTVSSVAGFRRDAGETRETFPYVMYMTIEFEKLKADNVVDKYITPYLSLYYDDEGRVREEQSKEIAKKISKFIKEKKYKEKYNLEEIFMVERKAGPVKSDIEIGLISNDDVKTMGAIKKIKEALSKVDGIVSINDNGKIGVSEVKFKINEYGQSLGIDEKTIGDSLSNLYFARKKSIALDSENMLDIVIESDDKDSIESLENVNIELKSGGSVHLKDVVEFNQIEAFEKIQKDYGDKTFFIYSNVDTKIITASEVLEKIEPVLEQIRQSGIKVKLKGEAEKNKELARDMMAATVIALTLILLSMLYLFNSFKDTFMVMSVIPFSFLGVLAGHLIMGLNLSMPSIVGALGLAGVVINDGIIMMTYLQKTKNLDELFYQAAKRFRPIVLTSVTTLVGLATLIFFPTGQAVIFQPLAVSIGFGLGWGTVINLLYLPAIYAVSHKEKYGA